MGPRFPHGTCPWAEGPRDSGLLVALFKAGRPPRPVFNSQWRILIGLRTSRMRKKWHFGARYGVLYALRDEMWGSVRCAVEMSGVRRCSAI